VVQGQQHGGAEGGAVFHSGPAGYAGVDDFLLVPARRFRLAQPAGHPVRWRAVIPLGQRQCTSGRVVVPAASAQAQGLVRRSRGASLSAQRGQDLIGRLRAQPGCRMSNTRALPAHRVNPSGLGLRPGPGGPTRVRSRPD